MWRTGLHSRIKGNLILLLVAFIWGTAFVAQSAGAEYVGAFTYNMTRNYLAFAFLIPVIGVLGRRQNSPAGWNDSAPNGGSPGKFPEDASASSGSRPAHSFHTYLKPDPVTLCGGISCGIALAVASTFQQIGIGMTTAGKAGFITSLYMIIVPILSIFLGRRIRAMTWICAAMAIFGLYLLCAVDSTSINRGDVLILICSLCFAVQMLLVDHFLGRGADGVKMAWIQYLAAALFSTPFAFLLEDVSAAELWDARISILYAGIFSSGIAYTLQIVGQKYTEPATATLILSLESVFAALSGWLLLHEVLSPREVLGCAIMFIAVVLAQVPLPGRKTD